MLTPHQARGSRTLCALSAGLAMVLLSGGFVAAQTFGFATMQPGTLNHTSGSAVAKVLKEKAGLNVVVQPTAGESVLIPLVSRGEAEFGIANVVEVQAAKASAPNLRLIGSLHPLRGAFWVRKDSNMRTMADLKGKRVGMGYSAMKTIDPMVRAILATGGLTEKDVTPVLIPNVIRGAEDFTSGTADMFFFAFGAPKVREVDATVGGIRALELDDKNFAAARKIMPWAYLTQIGPGPIFTGVDKPMKVYSFDNVIITSTKVPDDVVYKLLDAMEKGKDDIVTTAPAMAEFSPAFAYRQYGVAYHPGAVKFYKERNLSPRPLE